jgi:pimeloyl-ACP methyl ester carboxylesterase
MNGVGQDSVGDMLRDEPSGRVGADPGGRRRVVERFVENGGVRLNVATAGAGRPVLLLHGFPDSWRLWRHQIEMLAGAGHRVIAPDLRGFGRSSRPVAVADCRMSVLLGDVVAILEDAGVDRAAVVGHDWGAALAWQLAGSMPDRVERLVVVSVGHPAAGLVTGPGGKSRRSHYLRWFLPPGVAERLLPADDWRRFRDWGWHGAEPNTDPDCDRQIADVSRPGALTTGLNWYRANVGRAAISRSDPGPPVAERISCPTMGVWSSGDQFLTESQMTGSERFVTGGWRYERLTCDHWIPVHAADEFGRLLLDFDL